MLNKKNLTLAVSLLAALVLFAGCANAAATASPTTVPTVETRPAETAPAQLDLGQVKAIAYAHAGVNEAEATDRSYDFDDGCYEIEFDHGGWEYEYRIAPDGTIRFSEKTPEPTRPAGTQPAETKPVEQKPTETKLAGTQPKSERISREKALSIALSHAGVTDAYDKEAEWDDGRWEVSFDSGRTEYEYKISADGTILHWEKDMHD